MCKKGKACSDLGTFPGEWPKHSLLKPPKLLEQSTDDLSDAVALILDGRLDEARALLCEMPGRPNLRSYWDHVNEARKARLMVRYGRMSGPLKPKAEKRSPQRLTKNQDKVALFRRDGYRCRYCGARVIDYEVLRMLDTLVGTPEMRFKHNAGKSVEHGILTLAASDDHVNPWSSGGVTSLDNVVTACSACNYGKKHHSLEELGLSIPRPPAAPDTWDGLSSSIKPLRAMLTEAMT